MNIKKQDIEDDCLSLRSEEVQEIIGHSPQYLVVCGNVLLLIVVVSFIVVSCFISFPEDLTYSLTVENNKNGSFWLSSSELKKIKVGQVVLVEMHVYPNEQYGFLEADVLYISLIPKEHQYKVVVKFTKGYKTNRGNSLFLMDGMEGTVMVKMKEKSLINHLLSQ